MNNQVQPTTRAQLSTLWVVVLLNMIFADIFSIMVVLVNKSPPDIPGDVTTVMAVAAIATNVPILMVYLARVLPHRANRWANVVAVPLTIAYVVGGADRAPHYLIIASIEVIALLLIVVSAWRWRELGEATG